jgi:hypothetical protein
MRNEHASTPWRMGGELARDVHAAGIAFRSCGWSGYSTGPSVSASLELIAADVEGAGLPKVQRSRGECCASYPVQEMGRE